MTVTAWMRWFGRGSVVVAVLILCASPSRGIPAPVVCGNWCAEAYFTRSCVPNVDKPCTMFQFGTCHICPGDGSSNCTSLWFKGGRCNTEEFMNIAFDGIYLGSCACVGFNNKAEPTSCNVDLTEPYNAIRRLCNPTAAP
jgi:hypothetical protein